MKKQIGILLLTGLIFAGMSGVTAFAEDAGANTPNVTTSTDVDDVTVPFTKNLKIAEGVTVPTQTFSFDVTPQTDGAPQATIDTINYDNLDAVGILENNIYTISKTAAIHFEEFIKAGVYEYEVKETVGNEAGMSYDAGIYTLRVYVVNSVNGGFAIQTITAEKDETKQDELAFDNQYIENGALTIHKDTVGEQADKQKDFTFKIKFLKSGTEAEGITSYTGKIGEEDVVCAVGRDTEFQLHDGEELVFDSLPVGTRYIVTEVEEKDNYTPSIQVILSGTAVRQEKGTDGTDLSSSKNGIDTTLVGEQENKVTFTNTYVDTPITGLFLQRLPFWVMILVAVCASAGLAVVNGRKRS